MLCLLLGALLTSRPVWILILPLFVRDLGPRRTLAALAIAAAFTLPALYLGWSPSHLNRKYSGLTAVVMFVGAVAGSGQNRADRWLLAAALLTLPSLWATNEAYHVLLALPFLVDGLKQKGYIR